MVFAALMLVVAALDAVVDVAQNRHGFRVQRAYGPVDREHLRGIWSVGAVVGGLLASAAAGLCAAGRANWPRRLGRIHAIPPPLLNNQPVRHDDQDLGEAGRPAAHPCPAVPSAVPKPRPAHEVRR